MAITYIAIALGISFILTYYTIPPIITIANEKKLFDMPNGRRLNKIAIPVIGGIAIFFGWIIASMLCIQGGFEEGMQYLFVAMLLMFFVGLKDDIITIVAWKKFMVQICAAVVLVILGGYKIGDTYGFLGVAVFDEWMSIVISIVLILFITNAINLIDGIDGLSSGLSILISLCLGVGFYLSDMVGYAVICFALLGSLVAFLRFNLSKGKNKTFMGDTGSLVIGIFLSATVIEFSNNVAAENLFFISPPVMALALFIVPVTDTLRVFFIRIKNGKSPFSPDMNHVHHLLIRGGMTHIQGTCFLIVYTMLFMLLAYLFSYFELSITVSFFLVLSLSFVTNISIAVLSDIRYNKGKLAQQRS